MPGYLNMPKDSEPSFADYMKTRAFKPLRPGQTSYWQNYKKFVVSLQKSNYGAAATADNDWAYDYLPKLDVPTYDILRAFELMAQGKMNGYICQGFNPLQSFPNKKKIRAALGQAEVPRGDGSAGDRDRAVLGEPRRTEPVRSVEDRDRGFRAADDVLCRGGWQPDQLLTLGAVALEGGGRAGRGEERHRHHVGPVPAHARDVCEGWRCVPGSDPQPDVELHQPDSNLVRTNWPRRSTAGRWSR